MLRLLLAAMTAASLSDAQQALDAGNYSQAVELYRQHLAAENKPNYDTMYGLARSLAFAGRYPEALEAYHLVLKQFPKDPDALVGRGRVYAWMKKFVEADADFKAVIKAHPDNMDAWQAEADLYYWNASSKEVQTAADAFLQKWLKQFPKRSEPLLGQARYQISQRRFPLAREAISRARTLGADSAVADRLLTQINRQRGGVEWESLLMYEFQAFQQTQPSWHTGTAGIGHYFDWGFLSLQGTLTQRFGKLDQAVSADTYFDLWPGASGNARLGFDWAPQVLPRVDLFTQLYQGFGDIFEVSGGYRLMAFPASNVHFFNIGLASYLGNWYVGLQPMFYLSGEGPGAQVSAWARYLFDTADDFVELRTAFGRRIAVVGDTTLGVDQHKGQTTFTAAINGQYFITPNIGLLGTLDYNYDDQFPSRFGFTIGNKLRW